MRDHITTLNDGKLTKVYNETVKKVTKDYTDLHFNTAIAQMMVFINEANKVDALPFEYCEGFVKMLAPVAPHLMEEIWSIFGHDETISYEPWPTYDESALVSDEVNVVVQVNGKLRAQIKLAKDTSKEDTQQAAMGQPNVQKFTEGKDIKKVVVIPNKLVNIVAK